MGKIIYNLDAYVRQITRNVDTCQYLKVADNPSGLTFAPQCNKSFAHVKGVLVFNGVYKLTVNDIVNVGDRVRKGQRNYRYGFHKLEDGEFVFMLDTHGVAVPLGHPCHLHFPDSNTRIEHGDPRLNGYSLIDVDFLDVFGIVCTYMKNGGQLPWR